MRAGALALLIGSLLVAPTVGARGDEESSIPLRPGTELELEVDLGDGLRSDPGVVSILPHDVDEIRVEIDASGWGTWGVETRLRPVGSGAQLSVRVEGPTTWMFGGPKVRVRVLVPEETSLDVRCRGGELRIVDLSGRVRARTEDARVEVRGVTGAVKLRVVEGDVEAEEISGDLEVTSSDGEIRAAWVRGRFEARTGSGDIRLQHSDGPVLAKTLEGDVALDAVGGPVTARSERGQVEVAFSDAPGGAIDAEQGNIAVALPAGAGVALEATSTDGEVVVAPGLGLEGEHEANHARGAIGGGGAALVLHASRGQIRVSGR